MSTPVACAAVRRLLGWHRPDAERGQVGLLVLGLTVVAGLLVAGTVALTSAHLARMRLLDAADGAALAAADAMDERAYAEGLGEAVALSDATVRDAARAHLDARSLPTGVLGWHLGPGTGSPDGETAVVVLVGQARLPMGGRVLRSFGGTVTITVESRARSGLDWPG